MATVPLGSDWVESKPVASVRRRRWKLAFAAVVSAAAGGWYLFSPGAPVAETGAVASAVVHHAPAAGDSGLRGAAAMDRCRKLLSAAEDRLESVPHMTAVFQKQERIGGKLQPLNVMDLKVRHAPLSVYMKWQAPDEGQEIIWRDGAYDNKIVVCPAGWRRKVVRNVKIDPEGDQALAVSRRPIMNIGIWNFTSRLRRMLDEELMRYPTLEVTQTSGDEISGRPCDRFIFEHPGAAEPDAFQRLVIYIDRTLEVPVACEHYRWTEEAGKPVVHLEESYLFRDLNLTASLDEADFDEKNPAYEFTKK